MIVDFIFLFYLNTSYVENATPQSGNKYMLRQRYKYKKFSRNYPYHPTNIAISGMLSPQFEIFLHPTLKTFPTRHLSHYLPPIISCDLILILRHSVMTWFTIHIILWYS